MALMGTIKFPRIVEPTARVKTMRYFMTIFSFLFLIFGLAITASCIITMAGRLAACGFIGRTYTGVYLLLGAGSATVLFSLLGCMCSRQSTSATSFLPLGVVAMVVLVSQIMAAIAGHVFISLAADGGLLSSMNQTWHSVDNGGKECVDVLQSHFDCCGVQSPSEWLLISPMAGALSSPYPQSCQCASESSPACVTVNDSVANGTFIRSHIHRRGCHDVLLDDLQETSLIPRVVGPVVTLMEFAVVLVVLYFLHYIKNRSLVGVYVVGDTAKDNARDAREHRTSNLRRMEVEESASAPEVAVTHSENSVSLSKDESIHV